MSLERKLVNKLKRRERSVKEARKDEYKIDKREETMQNSPRVESLMRKPQRRMDKSFGTATVGAEPAIEYLVKAELERIDYGTSDFGVNMLFASHAQLVASGIQPGDWVCIEQDGSDLENRFLQVVAMVDGTNVRLDDVATFTGPESNDQCRIIVSGMPKSYK